MILVFYIALAITILLLLILIITFITCISILEIKVQNLKMSNIHKNKNNEKILIQISLKIGKIHWLKIKINKEKLAKLYVKIKKSEEKNNITTQIIKNRLKGDINKILKDQELKNQILNTKIELEKLNTNIELGTEDYILTSFLVAIISIIISNILPHIISQKTKNNIEKIIHYKISPIYIKQNIYNIQLSITMSTKISGLIQILIKIIKLKIKDKKEQKNKLKSQTTNKKYSTKTINTKKLNVKPV